MRCVSEWRTTSAMAGQKIGDVLSIRGFNMMLTRVPLKEDIYCILEGNHEKKFARMICVA